ncbi:MAG: PH domain-containing protein [Planctomycetes bacterium]|nr:PH domain-containing protein [Planctomycetota bacterium]MCH8969361.1 PH domain-containing protein [Planctomycetota bacterium]
MTQHDEQLGDKDARRRTRVGLAAAEALRPQRGRHTDEDSGPEEDLWQGRSSWKFYADLIVVAVGWTVIAAIVWFTTPRWSGWIVLIMALAGWVYVAGRVAHGMLNYHYRLTTQRLFIERGILSRTIDQAELIRIDDVRIHKSLMNRMTGVGSVELFSTDASDRQVTIWGVEKPEELAESIRDHMRRLRQRSLFVESL